MTRHNLPVKYASSGESKALNIIRYDLTRAYVNSSVAFTRSRRVIADTTFFSSSFTFSSSRWNLRIWRKQYINYEVCFQY